MNKPDMGNKMRAYLRGKPPLTVLTLQQLYADLAEQESDKPQVRYQLYRHALGNKAALHRPPRHYRREQAAQQRRAHPWPVPPA